MLKLDIQNYLVYKIEQDKNTYRRLDWMLSSHFDFFLYP